MSKLLYFPYISVPNNIWMKQTLLYWDQVASIVPFEYTRNPSMLGHHMQELVQEGLVKQVFPEEYVSEIHDFTENFMNYIDTDPLIKDISSIGKKGQIGKNKLLSTESIHMGKLSDIGFELVERGLAKENGHWFETESYTARAFMTYIAFLLGQKIDFTPSTDKYDGFDSILASNSDTSHVSNEKRVRDELRAKVLKHILPVPNVNFGVTDLLKFKENNQSELSRYRIFIEKFLIDIELTPEEFREEKMKLFLAEAADNIKYLREKLSFFGGVDFSFVTLCSLASSVFPITSAIKDKNTYELIGAVPGLVGAICSTFKSNNISELKRQPLAYAAISSKRLGYKFENKH